MRASRGTRFNVIGDTMHALFELSWRIYPASLLMLAGVLVAWRGLRQEVRAHRLPPRDIAKALTMVRGFRVAVVGLALVALGAAWAWQIAWLAVLSLIVGGEETLETSLVVWGLTRGRELRLRP